MKPIPSLAADLAEGRTTSRALVDEALARIDDKAGEGGRASARGSVCAGATGRASARGADSGLTITPEGASVEGGTTRTTCPTSIRLGFSRLFQVAMSRQFCPDSRAMRMSVSPGLTV